MLRKPVKVVFKDMRECVLKEGVHFTIVVNPISVIFQITDEGVDEIKKARADEREVYAEFTSQVAIEKIGKRFKIESSNDGFLFQAFSEANRKIVQCVYHDKHKDFFKNSKGYHSAYMGAIRLVPYETHYSYRISWRRIENRFAGTIVDGIVPDKFFILLRSLSLDIMSVETIKIRVLKNREVRNKEQRFVFDPKAMRFINAKHAD